MVTDDLTAQAEYERAIQFAAAKSVALAALKHEKVAVQAEKQHRTLLIGSIVHLGTCSQDLPASRAFYEQDLKLLLRYEGEGVIYYGLPSPGSTLALVTSADHGKDGAQKEEDLRDASSASSEGPPNAAVTAGDSALIRKLAARGLSTEGDHKELIDRLLSATRASKQAERALTSTLKLGEHGGAGPEGRVPPVGEEEQVSTTDAQSESGIMALESPSSPDGCCTATAALTLLTDHVDAIFARCIKGGRCTIHRAPRARSGCYHASLYDPSGHRIELMQWRGIEAQGLFCAPTRGTEPRKAGDDNICIRFSYPQRGAGSRPARAAP